MIAGTGSGMVKAALLAAALVLPAAATAGGAPGSTVRLTLAGVPANLGAARACPDGQTRLPIVDAGGRRVGSSLVCVVEARKTERAGYAVGTIVEKVVETDVLPSGGIRSRATYVFNFASADGSLARVSMRGTVTGGTGRYADARGSISGTGWQKARDKGCQRIRLTIRLRSS
jgi:hypothetical protein